MKNLYEETERISHKEKDLYYIYDSYDKKWWYGGIIPNSIDIRRTEEYFEKLFTSNHYNNKTITQLESYLE